MNKYGIYGSNDGCYWRLRPLSTPHTMSDFRDCTHSWHQNRVRASGGFTDASKLYMPRYSLSSTMLA
ncbi:MAG: hypothetical protein SPF96_07995 [Prevotella sp.]|nr:hypothetical protein [Prevotella sp.]